ncbi:MAG: acetate/propionate family kinase [Rhizobiaceae bacterium]|nr:acetate/propionate family kinase [Rhizobiaceae bacterium]
MPEAILTLNAGSSSIKFGLYTSESGNLAIRVKGEVEDVGDDLRMTAKDGYGARLADEDWSGEAGSTDALFRRLLDWIEAHLGDDHLVAVGHRIVHGGRDFQDSIRLTVDIVSALKGLTPLAPLHQPRSLAPIEAILELRPDLPQVGCFDTAFHRTIVPPASRYAIPSALEDEGIRRYGFHGLSYAHVASRLPDMLPGRRKVVVAHLGNGASLCAMRDGRSVDTTMGFSALDGLVMGTRPGLLDPGVLLFLMKEHGMSHDDLEDLLYRRSGMLGVSGLSADIRVLSSSDDPRAREAIDLFAFRVARETAAMANTLEGLDSIVFTGGIGENSPLVRRLVCERLVWLGVAIDPAANERGSGIITTDGSKVTAVAIAADEEIVIAEDARRLCGGTCIPAEASSRKMLSRISLKVRK